MVTSGYRLATVADLESLDLLHELMLRLAEDHPDVTALDWSLLETAMVELINNLILHGESPDGGPVEFALDVEVEPARLLARLYDTGSACPEPTGRAMPEVWAENGRGLALAEAVLDHLAYERSDARNLWTLIRLRTCA
ncbi:MAG: ATP-binding protein [Sporichthyaceae bacterium]